MHRSGKAGSSFGKMHPGRRRRLSKQELKAERRWRVSKLTVHRESYQHQRQVVNKLIKQAKVMYYTGLVHEKSCDQKALFGL